MRHFYPRPPRGGRLCKTYFYSTSTRFLSTPSARRATDRLGGCPPPALEFLSTPSARRATGRTARGLAAVHISIHALREEGDSSKPPAFGATNNFYPRPPRGGRQAKEMTIEKVEQFLSTPSARRATQHPHRSRNSQHPFLSTPSARRATRDFGVSELDYIQFLSTPSARRATSLAACSRPCLMYFYPRPPRGGRPVRADLGVGDQNFYPRPPRGGRRRPCCPEIH